MENNCQKQGSISKCFGDIRAIIAEVSAEPFFFFFLNGFDWNIVNVKTPIKEQFFLVDKQVNPFPPHLCHMH